ncbi:MAG TPA: hypothetical protein VEZ90_20025, partial [Blastocatellia bacterium]|nr:hypothetical protein [Blastocatellia bacterium]
NPLNTYYANVIRMPVFRTESSRMKTGWFGFDLPGYREFPVATTYGMFSYEDLPPLQTSLLEDLHWLESVGQEEGPLASSIFFARFPRILKANLADTRYDERCVILEFASGELGD